MHRSPGPRSNHTAISHTVGLFIFGGRRLKNGETTPGAPGGNDNNKNSLGRKKKKKKGNNNPHQKMLIVDLEYLNDLCLLIKEENQEDEETKSWVWIPVDVRGKLPRPRESATMTNVYNKSIWEVENLMPDSDYKLNYQKEGAGEPADYELPEETEYEVMRKSITIKDYFPPEEVN